MSTPEDGQENVSGWFRPEDGDAAAGASPALPPELSPRGAGGRAQRKSGSGSGGGSGSGIGGVARKAAVVLSALVVIMSATGFAVSQHFLGQVGGTDAFKGLTNRPSHVNVPAQNILVAGVDDRGTLTDAQKREYHVGLADYGRRSDTMILLHISDDQKSVTAISFPRDSLVTIPAYTDAAGVKHPASQNKLNAAFAFGDSKLTIATIEKATGVRIDHYIEVDLGGFVRMVNAVGGVDVCTTAPINDKDSHLSLPAGKSHLNGVQGLAFVRARHIYADQDLGRIRAQQRFVASMAKKATSSGVLLSPTKLTKFLDAATKSIHTDMSGKQLLDLAKQLREYQLSKITFLTVPIANPNLFVPNVGSAASWDEAKAKTLFYNIRNDRPIVKTPKTGKLTVPPGSITVQVLNGAGVQGLGAKAATDLAAIGFGMADIAKNADVSNQAGTVVRYDPTQAAASKTVIAAIPGATGLAVPGLGKTIEVVVGKSYTGAKRVTLVSSTPSTTPKPRTAADNICG